MVSRRKLKTGGSRRAQPAGRSRRRRSLTMEQVAEEYRRERKNQGVSLATSRQDGWGLAKIMAVTDTLPIDRATAIRIFDGNYKGTSRNQLIGLVKKLFKWVEEVHGIPNPIANYRAIPARRSEPKVLTQDEIRRLLDVARTLQNVALVMLIIDTGLRIGEAHSVTKASLLRYDDRLEVEVTGKTGMRRVPVSPVVFDMLMALGNGDVIWTTKQGKAVKVEALQSRFRRMMKRAGMSGERLGPHTMRHTAATHFIRNGGHVMMLRDLLGHGTVETTEQYVTLAGNDLHAAHGRYGLTAVMGLGGTEPPRPKPQPHVTVSGGVVNRVEGEWSCDLYDWALRDG